MSELELIATFFAFTYILLNIREYQISWLFAVICSALYIVFFWRTHFYYQSVLQVFFIATSVYGWWAWDEKRSNDIRISRLTIRQNGAIFLSFIPITYFAAEVLRTFTNSPAPLLDSTTAVLSIIATFLAVHKKIECWKYWIAVNLLAICMFAQQGLVLTTFVYAGFLVLSVVGLRTWTREEKATFDH